MNKVILMGRLTADPDIRYTQGENPLAIAKYSIAVDRRGNSEDTDFIRITAFGRGGEFAEKYLHKGTKVLVTGRIQTGSYTDATTNKKVYTQDVIAEDQEFCESKHTADNDDSVNDQGFMNIPEGSDGDLPFAQPTR